MLAPIWVHPGTWVTLQTRHLPRGLFHHLCSWSARICTALLPATRIGLRERQVATIIRDDLVRAPPRAHAAARSRPPGPRGVRSPGHGRPRQPASAAAVRHK